MPRWRSIWLVARREILERGRSRGFILSVAFTTLIVVGSFVIPAIVFGGDNPTKVGIVDPSPSGLQAAIEQSAERFDHKVVVTTYPSSAAADEALTGGGAGGGVGRTVGRVGCVVAGAGALPLPAGLSAGLLAGAAVITTCWSLGCCTAATCAGCVVAAAARS